MKKQFRLLTIACLIGGMLHLTGCKKDDVVPAPTGINLTSNSTLGSILTDNKGQTLYFFSQDANGQSSCTSGCTSTWPVFHTAGTPVLGTGLADADFGERFGANVVLPKQLLLEAVQSAVRKGSEGGVAHRDVVLEYLENILNEGY